MSIGIPVSFYADLALAGKTTLSRSATVGAWSNQATRRDLGPALAATSKGASMPYVTVGTAARTRS